MQSLENAESLYASGRPELVPETLATCIEKGFDRKQQIRAYELIILSYLYLDDNIKSAEAMLQILKFEKEFELTGREPTEFKKLYDAFRTQPIFMLGLQSGGNSTFAQPSKLYSIGEISRDSMQYSTGVGFQVGIVADLQIGKHLLISTGVSINRLNYSFAHSIYDFTKYNLKEKQLILSVPLGVKIATGGKKLKPYVSLGVGLDHLARSDIQINRSFPNRSIVEITGQDINATSIRSKSNYHIYGGMGFKFKVPNYYLFMEARVANGRINQVKPEARFNNSELLYRYGHVDNDFILNHISISMGVQYNFYKPKIKGKYFYH